VGRIIEETVTYRTREHGCVWNLLLLYDTFWRSGFRLTARAVTRRLSRIGHDQVGRSPRWTNGNVNSSTGRSGLGDDRIAWWHGQGRVHRVHRPRYRKSQPDAARDWTLFCAGPGTPIFITRAYFGHVRFHGHLHPGWIETSKFLGSSRPLVYKASYCHASDLPLSPTITDHLVMGFLVTRRPGSGKEESRMTGSLPRPGRPLARREPKAIRGRRVSVGVTCLTLWMLEITGRFSCSGSCIRTNSFTCSAPNQPAIFGHAMWLIAEC
jgi:hypothetical protein